MSLDESGGDAVAGTALFTIVWEALAEALGTAAVVAIIRRAVGRAAAEAAELAEVVILREDFEYVYTLPPSWSQEAPRAPLALRVLVVEIGRLLVELTGTVVVQRLEKIPALRGRGLLWRPEGAN